MQHNKRQLKFAKARNFSSVFLLIFIYTVFEIVLISILREYVYLACRSAIYCSFKNGKAFWAVKINIIVIA